MLYVVGFVTGVTCLDNIIYVVCAQSSTIRLYNMDTFSPHDVINVDGMRDPRDIVVCHHDRQLYVGDVDCIWQVLVDRVDSHTYMKWLLTQSLMNPFDITSLSLTSKHLLVTAICSLHQISIRTLQTHTVNLPQFLKEVRYSVQTADGTFITSHRGTSQDDGQCAVSECSV